MEKFSGLLKQKSKHLAVFEQARQGLLKVQGEIHEVIADRQDLKVFLQSEIKQADAEMEWLANEAARTGATADKISAVLA